MISQMSDGDRVLPQNPSSKGGPSEPKLKPVDKPESPPPSDSPLNDLKKNPEEPLVSPSEEIARLAEKAKEAHEELAAEKTPDVSGEGSLEPPEPPPPLPEEKPSTLGGFEETVGPPQPEGPPGSPPEEAPTPSPLPPEEEEAEGEGGVKVASIYEREPVWKRILPIIGVGILLLMIVFFSWRFLGERVKSLLFKAREVTLTYWGLWEPESVMEPLIEEFQKEFPHIKIRYVKQSPENYRERLQAALAREGGPDIFRIHNTWVPMLKSELSPLPEKLMSVPEFEKNFYGVASETLRWQDKIYALPLMYDGLALFINEEIFSAAGETPPTDWIELREKASKLTVYNEEGEIKIAGVALGTANNVDHFSDILGLMILQNGGSLVQPTNELTEQSLVYYTLFSRVDHVWDENLPVSTYAFATGKLAMYFGPSWRVFNIQEINRDLHFKVVPVPQLSESEVNWASFWAEAVSQDSENQEAAWQFLKFLTEKESLQKLYELESKLRTFGEPYPRREMADLLRVDSLVSPFLEGATTARSWYLCSRTFDNGINDRIIKYYEDVVNRVVQGEEASGALRTASQGITQVLTQYGL